jgi:hypothetical protein
LSAFFTRGFVRSRGPTVPKCFTYPQAQLIDATAIGSAGKGDKEAAWVKHRTRVPAPGYKAHIAADKTVASSARSRRLRSTEPDVAIAPRDHP